MTNKEKIEALSSFLTSEYDITFKDKMLLAQSMVHASFSNENNFSDNERLEFLGNSILQACIRSYYYDIYPSYDEGKLAELAKEFE